MRVTQIEYALTKSCDYDNCRAGVVVELDESDSPVEAMKRAREFVCRQVQKDIIPEWEVKQAKEVLLAASKVSAEKIEQARQLLDKLDGDDLPF